MDGIPSIQTTPNNKPYYNGNMDSVRPADAARCPLCGGPNQCALTANPSATECWCDSEVFPRGLLELIPDNALRRVCVCQKCLLQYRESTTTHDNPS